MVPFLGAFSNSITAIALTEFLARWMDEFLDHPDQPPPEVTMEGLKTLFMGAIKRSKAAKEKDAGSTPNGATSPVEGKP